MVEVLQRAEDVKDGSRNITRIQMLLICLKMGGGDVLEPIRREIRQVQTHYQRKNCKKPDGTWGYANWRTEGEQDKKIITWDTAPPKEYFEELFRVSRNQIIWGGNYFELPPTRCFVVWRKLTISESFSMAMAEYAWTSFNDNAKIFECAPQDPSGNRFHPTQKPVKLYEWLLNRYAHEGDKILDTHVGSASSLIACQRLNFNFVGFEIDSEYYRLASERFERETAQMTLANYLAQNKGD